MSGLPAHLPPELSGDVGVNFDETNSVLNLDWPPATDADTIDNRLVYEVNFTPVTQTATSTELDDGLWLTAGGEKSYKRTVAPGDNFTIGIRAKDDFGNFSNVALAAWQYPPANFFITQGEADDWSDSWGQVRFSSFEPDSASFQSITPEENFDFDKVAVRLWHDRGADDATARLSVYGSHESGNPNFDDFLGEATVGRVLYPAQDQDFTFTFDGPISLEAGGKYWLVLDLAASGWDGSVGYFRNSWKNAVGGGGAAYALGEAGKGLGRGRNETCDSCVFNGNYLSIGPADWYMKIGLKEERF